MSATTPRLQPADYDALFDVLATIDPVDESDRVAGVGYFDTPDGRRVAEVVEGIIARHLNPAAAEEPATVPDLLGALQRSVERARADRRGGDSR